MNAALALGCVLVATSGVNEVSGTVSYLEKVALPSSAVVTVTLEDQRWVSRPVVIAETRFATNGAQPPLPFRVTYREGTLDKAARPRLRARIESANQFLFATSEAVRVVTNGITRVDLVLRQVGPEAQALVDVRWELVEMAGRTFAGDRAPWITLDRNNRFAAFLGINTGSGTYSLKGNELRLTTGGQTSMAGPREAMEAELRFIAGLKKVTGFQVRSGRLELRGAGGLHWTFVNRPRRLR